MRYLVGDEAATLETEETLHMIALHGTAHHVERSVRQFRRAQEAAEWTREAQQFIGRRVSYFYDDDGSHEIELWGKLLGEAGVKPE